MAMAPQTREMLPIASFTRVEDELAEPVKAVDNFWTKFGYVGETKQLFKRPEDYYRYIEPLESELAQLVEYDMDEEDKEWLDRLNDQRKKSAACLEPIPHEAFEVIMDKLEKEWLNLEKNALERNSGTPSEDALCARCNGADSEEYDQIVFCDGCNLAVHQSCYGITHIPEGQWLCKKCNQPNQKSCRLVLPVLPEQVIDETRKYIETNSIQDKDKLVSIIYQYWCRKRGSSGGAPLIHFGRWM